MPPRLPCLLQQTSSLDSTLQHLPNTLVYLPDPEPVLECDIIGSISWLRRLTSSDIAVALQLQAQSKSSSYNIRPATQLISLPWFFTFCYTHERYKHLRTVTCAYRFSPRSWQPQHRSRRSYTLQEHKTCKHCRNSSDPCNRKQGRPSSHPLQQTSTLRGLCEALGWQVLGLNHRQSGF